MASIAQISVGSYLTACIGMLKSRRKPDIIFIPFLTDSLKSYIDKKAIYRR